MRDELSGSRKVGKTTVDQAILRVEEVVRDWSDKYRHITRGVAVKERIIELETLFSKPTQGKPVPVAAVSVHFALDTITGELSYQFEQESVRHKVGGQSLVSGKFECWLDRITSDKLQVRTVHDLATAYETTRLVPPPVVTKLEVDLEEHALADDRAEEVQQSEPHGAVAFSPNASQMEQLFPLSTLLANIFDAADEEDEGELTHKEVAELLYATPLGLADWDIKLLLTTAQELRTGKIEWKPFVQAAPEIVEALLKRRAAYEDRAQQSSRVTHEAIDLCHGEEIEEVARAVREAFASYDNAATGTLCRHDFKECLMSKGERLAGQEVQMLMQMCKEDETGQVPYDEFTLLLQQLRIDALHNALVETDVRALRIHMILLLRREGLGPDLILPVWNIRNVLLNADQICLSRVQIHVILSIIHPNEHGEVDVQYFLRVACTIIPQLFDTAAFIEKAAAIAKEKADAIAKQELEELQGIASKLSDKRQVDDEDQEETHANAPDRDAVEKALIHVGNLHDEKHRSQASLDVYKFLEAMRHEHVQQCQLSDAELRGFIAEAELDERREVAFVEHVKTWVPIIFELRKSKIYEPFLTMDWGLDDGNLFDLAEYEEQFPILSMDDDSGGSRASSAAGSPSRTLSGGREGGSGSNRSSQARPHSRASGSRGAGVHTPTDQGREADSFGILKR
mmetsp:Transcript_25638/g.59250  ORF Transcript_25638/g.59250 Transcript_25638/m.59250 type:complete len:684 (-) Transcript_25638:82-2133(-)